MRLLYKEKDLRVILRDDRICLERQVGFDEWRMVNRPFDSYDDAIEYLRKGIRAQAADPEAFYNMEAN